MKNGKHFLSKSVFGYCLFAAKRPICGGRINIRGKTMLGEQSPADHLALAADIVAAYVSNNSVPSGEVPALIHAVHASLLKATAGATETPAEPPKEPAVPIKKSITNDYLICLEDGKKFKSLKRHLATAYDLTPSAYRAKWGLPSDYPMVAPGYSATRSELAKAAGLGNARAAAKAVGSSAKVVDEPKKTGRGRPKKSA